MADKKLSSMSAASDASFVYAETSDGKAVKISKADLASVVAGLLSIPSGSRAFASKVANSNNGSVSIDLGKIKGIIYAKSVALNGDKIKCFMAKTSSVEVIGSALDSIFENYVTAAITDGNLVVTARTTSGTGFVDLNVWYFG